MEESNAPSAFATIMKSYRAHLTRPSKTIRWSEKLPSNRDIVPAQKIHFCVRIWVRSYLVMCRIEIHGKTAVTLSGFSMVSADEPDENLSAEKGVIIAIQDAFKGIDVKSSKVWLRMIIPHVREDLLKEKSK